MSCGQPCWNCGEPIPAGRHNLSPMIRVFCSEACRIAFPTVVR
jgi:predicted nucleic acid-binding Zn ribbon protein